jgi:glycosyltransferase involved in cell wall biosynthesis
MDFVEKYYKIPRAKLEFYPLGGVVYSDSEFHALRKRGRERLGLSETSVCLFQSGKFDRKKKLSETIRALRATDSHQIQLVVAGSFAEDVRNEIEILIAETPTVRFLGWVDSNSLAELLCASDAYLQPGTQSATMQLAICARCPVILDDAPSHRPFVTGNGWLVSTEADLVNALRQIQSDPAILLRMSTQSLKVANALLDYRTLAARLYR